MSESVTAEVVTPINDSQTKNILPFEFRGQGFEYFKLWVVNALLTVLTFGIYSAWATVRNNRYLHANLYLNNTHFRYLATPMQILKGRIIAIVALIIYMTALQFMPTVGAILGIALFIAIPYFVNQSLAFDRRMTSYNNIQFRFSATYWQAVKALILWPLLGILTMGILYPKAFKEIYAYLVNNSSYGKTQFQFSAKAWDYGKPALVAAAIMLVLGLIGFGIISAVPAFAAFLPVIVLPAYLFLIIFFIVTVNNIFYRNLHIDEHNFNANFTMLGLFKVILINVLLTIVTLGLYLPAAKIRMIKYLAQNVSLEVNGSLENFRAAPAQEVGVLGEEMGQAFDFGV